jgi:hypothetical protein
VNNFLALKSVNANLYADAKKHAGAHPILQAILTWIETVIAETPTLTPYLPTILADLAAGNWVAALTLITEVLSGNPPPVPTPTPTPAD